MPFIEINGKKIEAESGSMIIEVADQIGIQIPRFCYHKKLSIAANCRMCLVDVEKAPKPLPACATPITEGMKIWTQSPKAILAQKSVMEFLLINHPLDCPICDQGGECELQDLAMGFGDDYSRYTEGKRVVIDKNLGPLIATDMTRCIQCTRCVRFGTEVAGVRELGATGRGEHMEIGTYIEKNMESEVSGNVIDLCPVGALTSKPFRFSARGWELTQKPSIAPHDCMGSNIFLHVRRHQILRTVPRENESINEVWISDRDRFSYEALNSPERLLQPKIKRDGRWYTVSWSDALQETADSLLELIHNEGPEAIGTLVSPNATLEECYLIQKWMRCLGVLNIDHRLRQGDFRNQSCAPLIPSLDMPIRMVEQQSSILLVGSSIRKEQPLMALKLRKMTQTGGKVFVVNPIDFAFNFDVTEKIIVPAGDLVSGLASIAKVIIDTTKENGTSAQAISSIPPGAKEWLKDVKPQESAITIANQLISGEKKLILLGALAQAHPSWSHLIALATLIAKLTGAKIGVLSDGANSAGAWLTGCVPHRLPGGKPVENAGLDATQMWEQSLKAYVLFNMEPDLDCLDGMKALQALQKAEKVIAITPFESKTLLEHSDILLPMTPFSETSGTWVNMEGEWQSFQAAVSPMGESRPAWKICRVLGNLCGCEGFEFESTEDVKAALGTDIGNAANTLSDSQLVEWSWECLQSLEQLKSNSDVGSSSGSNSGIIRIAPVPLYASDGIVRRAQSLQKTKDAGSPALHINKSLATRLGLKDEDKKVYVTHADIRLTLPFTIDDTIPDNSVMIASGLSETVSLGGPYTTIEIQKIKDKNA